MAQKIASLYAEIGADTSKLQKGLKESKAGLAGFADRNKATISQLGIFVGVATAAGAAVKSIADETANYNKTIREGSQVTGMAVEEFSRLVQVGDDWGITADSITTALAMMRQKGVQPSIGALADLADEFVAAGDTTAFAEKAVGTLGRGWKTLVPLLAKGGDALRDQAAAVDESLIATNESIAASRTYEVALDALNDQILALKLNIGNKLIPELVNLLPVTKEVVDWTTLETKTQKGVERQYALVAGQLRDVTDLYRSLTPEQLATLTATQQLNAALGESVPILYDYVYRVTDVDEEASRAAQAVTNFAIGVDKTAESTEKAKGPLDDFLDGVNRDIGSPIAAFIKDLQWFQAGGGKIEAAFSAVQEALAAGKITPEQADMFAKELFVATTDLQLELNQIDAKQAAANLDETLGRQARLIAMQDIKGTEGIEGALASISGIQYYLDFKFRYSGTPPSAYTNSGGTTLPTGGGGGPNPRANGGPVTGGNIYKINEREDEWLYMPKGGNGFVVPDSKMGAGGGGDVFADITINAAPGMDVNAVAAAVVARLNTARRVQSSGGAYRGV